MRSAALLAVLATGCTVFQDPTIVLDLRVIGMTAHTDIGDYAEHVIEVDLMHPPRLEDVVAQLNRFGSQNVCALLADPGSSRAIDWTMTACALDADQSRCDPARPQIHLGTGQMRDPEAYSIVGDPPGQACVRYAYDQALVALLLDILKQDPTSGLGGIDYVVELRAGGEDQLLEDDVYAFKQIRISPRIPETRMANHNPSISEVQVAVNFGGGFPTQPKHCADADDMTHADIQARSGDVVTLYPVEPQGTREEFIVPTLDGQFEKFTEAMTYQWLATAGAFSDDITGGPPDIFGNETLLGTDWTAPRVSSVAKISLWVVQRDERYGASMREMCVRVSP